MKHTVKFLCVAISLVMLFAMSVPAMAEGETIFDTRTVTKPLNETFDNYTSDKEKVSVDTKNGDSVLKMQENAASAENAIKISAASADAVKDNVYEAGFKIWLDNCVSSTFMIQLIGSTSYPILDLKFVSGSAGTYQLQRGSTALLDRSTLVTGDWNDIRFVIKEVSNEATGSVDVYLNSNYVMTTETKAGTKLQEDTTAPYYWRFYPYQNTISSAIYLDDVYIGKYTPVTSFTQEATTVKVVKGQEAQLPATVNVAVNGTTEAVAATWGEVSGTTVSGTADAFVYGSGDAIGTAVPISATITEIDMPYTAAISDGTLTVTKETSYAPAAVIYGAAYDGNGKLTSAAKIGTITADEAWSSSTKTVDMGTYTKAFVWDSALMPLAAVAE